MERKRYLDLLRGLAAIAVVFIHVAGNNWYGFWGSTSWLAFTTYIGVCKLAVPIFFMISGCLFLDDTKNKPIKKLYSSTIKRLVIFLLFWASIYKILQLPAEGTFAQKMWNALLEVMNGNTQNHLWYIYGIIGLYILSPMLKIFANNATKSQLLYAIAVCFVFGSLSELFSHIPEVSFLAVNINKIKCGVSVGYIGFFLLGYYLDKYEIERKQRILLYLCGVLGLTTSIGMVMFDCITHQSGIERYWSYTMPGMVIASAAVFVLFKYKKKKIFGVDVILENVAKYSLGIYGCHFIFIMFIWATGFTTLSFHGIISVPVISMVVLMCSYVTSWVVQKIPLVGKYLA